MNKHRRNDTFQITERPPAPAPMRKRADAPLTPAEAMARCHEVTFAVAALQHAAQNMAHPDPMIDAALAPFTKGSDG